LYNVFCIKNKIVKRVYTINILVSFSKPHYDKTVPGNNTIPESEGGLGMLNCFLERVWLYTL